MNAQDVQRALRVTLHSLYGFYPSLKPARYDPSQSVGGVVVDSLRHCIWMVEEALTWDIEQRKEKAMRWLCFVQGVMWMQGLATINELKQLNKPHSPNVED